MVLTIIKAINSKVVDFEEEAIVRIVHRFTDRNEATERLIRYEMDAIREFVNDHPWQSWNPLFFLFPGLGQELVDGIVANKEAFERAQAEKRHPAGKATQADVFTTTSLERLRKEVWLERKRQGYVNPEPNMHQLALHLRQQHTGTSA